MSWSEAFDLAGAIFLLLGALLAFIGALGLVRLPDIFARMHAATKPQMLGLMLTLTGLALYVRTWESVATIIVVMGAQGLTAPVTAHLLGRAGYRAGVAVPELLHHDDLGEDYRRMQEK